MKINADKTTTMLFLSLCIIWGFTWISGKYQINAGILPEIAVSYRFLGVCIMMFFVAKFLKESLEITSKEIKILFPYFACCGSLNFIMFYYVANFMTTSISAIIFSFSIIIIALLKHYLKISNENIKVVLISSFIGVLGLLLVMFQKLNVALDKNLAIGVIIAFLATFLYSAGALYYERNRAKLSISSISSFFYVALFGVIISFFTGLINHFISGTKISLMPQISIPFILSYVYLVISGLGILFMMMLIQRIGAVNASYINLITPVVAVFVSSIFEDYKLIPSTFIGLLFIIASNYIAIRSNSRF
jgi:drug/metabolite transporter (DMT)-like permease